MIIVTGGAGFIGSVLVAELCARGVGPIVVCDWMDAPEKTANLRKHEIEALIENRQAARAAKDFAAADKYRDQLVAAGIQIEDGAGGTTWRRSG